jgi:CDP-6-deoxy-D-xylo-4-hexulose-3-dehydrase
MTVKYPLATFTWDENEYSAIREVIDSKTFTMGSRVQTFEKLFAEEMGAKYCVMVNSGSSANLLMVASLFYTKNDKYRLKAGDEVIVPAVSWSTTYYPLYQYGLKLKFVDIDPLTLNLDINSVRSAVTDDTRAIFAVNLLGNPCDYNELRNISEDHSLILIEDNCEAMGAKFDGRHTGTFGLMGSYSTFYSHHISTMEGGLIVTDNEELHQILLCLRAHGWTRNLPDFNLITGQKDPDPFEESFKFVLPGYNLRPLEMEGAIGIEQVKKLKGIIKERRRNGSQWTKTMENHPQLLIQQEVGESSWFGFSVVIRENANFERSKLVAVLRDLGFECRPIVTGNFAKNPVVKYFNHDIHGSLTNANRIDSHGLFIGNHHYPINECIDAMAEIRIK